MKTRDIAVKFADRVVDKFKEFIKSVVLFGSAAREEEARDIDLLIIVDDTLLPWTVETYNTVYHEIGKILEDFEEKEKIHPNVLVLTAFVNNLIKGDPILVNIVRDGIPIYDVGVFSAMQRLLRKGTFKPSPEAVQACFNRALIHEGRIKWKLLTTLIDVYWAMIMLSEAYLLKQGIIPRSPSEIPDQLKEILKGEKYPEWLREIYNIQKEIARYQKKEVTIEELKKWLDRLKEFSTYMEEKLKS